MRKRRLKKLSKGLQEIQQQKLTRDELLIKVGAAKKEAGRTYYLVEIRLPEKDHKVTADTFGFALRKKETASRSPTRRQLSFTL